MLNNVMLASLMRSQYEEQIALYEKQPWRAQHEWRNRARADRRGGRLAAVERFRALTTKVSAWIGRLRPARAG